MFTEIRNDIFSTKYKKPILANELRILAKTLKLILI